jgi:Ser/Thr protein kinase RdoA (MazF antagonist)
MINVQPEPEMVAAHVGAAYDVSVPVTATLLRRGFNDTFRIDASDGARYAFRVYFNGKYYIGGPDDFRFELELLDFVAERGVPVARPRPRRDDGLLDILPMESGDRCAALFTWADGAPAKERTPEQARVMGEALARFHVAADAFATSLPRYRLDLTYLLDQPLAGMRTYLQTFGREAEIDAFVPFAEALRARVVALPTTRAGVFGILHGDPHGGNVHFNDAGEVTLFDFDHGGYGWRIWDVATALGNLSGPTRAALLAGYDAVRPLADAERGTLRVFRALRPLWDRGDVLAMRVAWGTENDAPTDEFTEKLLHALEDSRRRFIEAEG